MRLILTLAIVCGSNFANADDQITILKEFCEKNQADYWAKNSESCRLVRGEYKLDQLCEGYSKGNSRHTVRLQSIADKYAELKSMESDAALQILCKAQVGSNAVAAKAECSEEREGKRQITRKWWDGSAWVTTKENPTAVKEKADKGDRSALYNLGVWHLNGETCVSRDIKVAAPFLCRAYDSGEKMAGLEFQKVINHPSDFKAREMFGKANGCELTTRQKEYAVELKKIADQAMAQLKKAEAGDVKAMIKTGEAYLNGDFDDSSGDSKLAFQWFKKAADKGSAEGMGHVGALYGRGDGVERDNSKAFEWFLKAAKGGDLDSMYAVGLNYYDGQGIEEDLTKAVQWLVKAMDRGHVEAKEKLAEMYLRGELQAVAFRSISDRLKKLESKK